MFQSLYSKLAAILAALFVGIGVGFLGVTIVTTDLYRQEITQKLNRHVADDIVSEKLLIRNNQIDREALGEIFHMLMVINPGIEVYLLSPDGRILAFSAKPEKVVRDRVSLLPVRSWLETEPMLPLLGDDPRSATGRKVFSAARIEQGGRLEGYLYVILGGEAYDSVVQKLQGSHILRLSAWIIGGGLVFSLGAALLLFGRITGRLRRLTGDVRAFRANPVGSAVPEAADPAGGAVDEIDELRRVFAEMAFRIRAQIEELRNADRLRRELVANVSHDLRTPLATLQGYVETLLMKENDLSSEDRREYLRTAVRHCERLNRLVGELFELARLDARETPVRSESFSLGELVQDVVQKFELGAGQRGVTIETNVGEAQPFARGDIALVERVLENLIENAVRFTPRGGTIRVVLTPHDETIGIDVADTGPGISAEDLPRIFDRFFRPGDPSRGDPGDHAGLGLAIAKRILELHDQPIHVTSEGSAGATFSFRLPLHRPA